MIGMHRKTRQHTARGLLALMAGMWLLTVAAPCVMAAAHCPEQVAGMPCEPMDPSAQAPDCDSAQAADCRQENTAPARNTTLQDLPLAPALSARDPLAMLTRNPEPPARDPDRLLPQLSPPPLYLQHAVLLI